MFRHGGSNMPRGADVQRDLRLHHLQGQGPQGLDGAAGRPGAPGRPQLVPPGRLGVPGHQRQLAVWRARAARRSPGLPGWRPHLRRQRAAEVERGQHRARPERLPRGKRSGQRRPADDWFVLYRLVLQSRELCEPASRQGRLRPGCRRIEAVLPLRRAARGAAQPVAGSQPPVPGRRLHGGRLARVVRRGQGHSGSQKFGVQGAGRRAQGQTGGPGSRQGRRAEENVVRGLAVPSAGPGADHKDDEKSEHGFHAADGVESYERNEPFGVPLLFGLRELLLSIPHGAERRAAVGELVQGAQETF
mmetsp:Transcript_25598/g.77035  ORF Transcript_25598/g.77035 Transcript_25598/m.77035 type:complete len:303 (-) Transcript_25598:564-1472(-)